MAVDLLNIARTGVLASQSQLAVTSNNIANVNTNGYHRQVATQSALESQYLGGNFLGTGSYVNDVKRIYNDYAARELRIGQTASSAAQTSYSKLSELDQLFSKVGSMVSGGLNNFFSSINSVADLPTDLGLRNNVIDSAGQLATSLNQMQSYIDGQVKQTNSQIESITTRINEISKELGSINLELMKTQTEDPQLLDKQDALINELSEYSAVNVIPLENGAKSIMLGGSVMLVSAEVSMTMGVTPGDPYPNEPRLTTSSGNNSLVVDPSKLGGQLGALFEYRDESLMPASHELGQLALGIADTFNQMQTKGFDLNGEVGGDMFRDINDPLMAIGRAGSYSTNTGNATLSVNIDDVGTLTGSSYELKFTAPATYELTDTQSGEVTPLTLNPPSELVGGAGFTINIDAGAMADGDRFEIRPTANAASSIAVTMTDPRKLAVAGPTITADENNTSAASVSLNGMDPTAAGFPGVGSEITFQLNTATNTYEAFDAAGTSLGTGTYTPPEVNAFGISFDVSNTNGATAERFKFDLTFAEGNNNNAIEMAKLANENLMNGGTTTLTGVFENTKLDIGSKTKAAEVRVGSADAIYQQAYNRVQTESGVNLDEEAANLLRFQQTYQASARIMSTAQTIFDSLIGSVR
ncbi:flagellar hook-associated protein FlgK [Shewanella maritima]|uniref:Flagellar hook-associated protein 1 n=1 Tax=Shewanella maritima TaxID=2520507 RepID=A0A411PDT0_9GAMM|nr:flagellar hook-associated protein FlgK [Shewanella maritima]QBF81757.1 flagellar hook-associated protein FlgK [Shewanella maritima]